MQRCRHQHNHYSEIQLVCAARGRCVCTHKTTNYQLHKQQLLSKSQTDRLMLLKNPQTLSCFQLLLPLFRLTSPDMITEPCNLIQLTGIEPCQTVVTPPGSDLLKFILYMHWFYLFYFISKGTLHYSWPKDHPKVQVKRSNPSWKWYKNSPYSTEHIS